jgi:hypothetical protein
MGGNHLHGARLRRHVVRRSVLAAVVALAFAPTAFAGDTSPAASTANVVPYRSNLTNAELNARAATDVVEFADGRRVRVGDLRKLAAVAKRMHAGSASGGTAAVLRAKPAAQGGTPVRNGAELAQSLDRPDSETLVLPSGRRLTVGQLKLLQPRIEKQLGRSLTSVPKRQLATSGTAVKVGANPDWKKIFAMPDATLLEAPNGARISVKELKADLATHSRSRTVAPQAR